MKKIVISGSSKLQIQMAFWKNYFENEGNIVLDYPKKIEGNFFMVYPKVHADFYKNIVLADMLFVANEDKSGIKGYIGASSFAEISYTIAQNLNCNKKIEIVLLQIPSSEIFCIDEINLWLKLGWIKLYNK